MKLDGWEESCMLIEGRGGAVQRFEFPKVVLGPEVQQDQVFDTVTPEMLEVRPLLPHQSVCSFAQAPEDPAGCRASLPARAIRCCSHTDRLVLARPTQCLVQPTRLLPQLRTKIGACSRGL